MSSEFHWWGLDIQFTAAGDDATVSGIDEINQDIVRACMTAPGEYVWDPTYGLGLGLYVGQALTPEKFQEIKGGIISVVVTQRDVQQQPEPVITFVNDLNGLLAVQISYVYAPTGTPVTLQIPPSQ